MKYFYIFLNTVYNGIAVILPLNEYSLGWILAIRWSESVYSQQRSIQSASNAVGSALFLCACQFKTKCSILKSHKCLLKYYK